MKWKRFPTDRERFFSAVDQSGDCWIWKAARKSNGYGVFKLSTSRSMNAHRAAYILTFGEIQDGLHVCHRCDNPPCVNPAHLFLGTIKENAQDCARKGRRPKTVPNNWRLPFTQRKEIVERLANGEGLRALGREFGVSHSAIAKLRRKFPEIVAPLQNR